MDPIEKDLGLDLELLGWIARVCYANKKVKAVYIHGSRALGKHKKASDVDVLLEGDLLTRADLLNLRWDLDALPTLLKIDLAALHLIKSQEFKNDVLQNRKLIPQYLEIQARPYKPITRLL